MLLSWFVNVNLLQTFIELRNKQLEYSKQLNATRSQITLSEREKKRAELTLQEVAKLPTSTRTFVGVGRMYDLHCGSSVSDPLAGSC